MIRALIIPIGSTGGLNWWKSLRNQPGLRLMGADGDAMVAGRWLCPDFFTLPSFDSEEFSDNLLRIVEEWQVSVILPSLEPVLEPLVQLSQALEDRGALLVLPPLEVLRLTTDKRLTYAALENAVHVPRDFTNQSDAGLPYPVLVKPARSTGSRNIFVARNQHELVFWRGYVPEYIVQEYLPGPEYTTDCLSDLESNVLVASPRLRHKVRAGLSVISITVADETLQDMAQRISGKVGLQGPWFFQTRRNSQGEHVVTEVNARLAGGVMATVKAGANIPWLALQLYLTGQAQSAQARPGVTMTRYYEEVFVEGDEQL